MVCKRRHTGFPFGIGCTGGGGFDGRKDLRSAAENARVKSLVVYGKLRLFGILGRRPDLTVPWESIDVIGEDAILVKVEELPKEAVRRSKWAEFWNG